jgi:hypothetical protein
MPLVMMASAVSWFEQGIDTWLQFAQGCVYTAVVPSTLELLGYAF